MSRYFADFADRRRGTDEEVARITSDIQSLYDSGTRLFTKEAIRDIAQQLENTQNGQKIFVRGINGVTVGFDVEYGEVDPHPDDPSLEQVAAASAIDYHSIEMLTCMEENRFPEIAYCSFRIVHSMIERDKVTKEVVLEPVLSRQETEERFGMLRKVWDSSEACENLKSILRSITLPSSGIRKIVAFGLGNMSQVDPKMIFSERSIYQHALLLTLRDILSSENERDGIICYAQDPAYTKADQDHLKSLGITCLDDPKGFLEVDESTLVLSIAPNVPVKNIITDIARPAMMVWDSIGENKIPGLLYIDPDSPRLVRTLEECYDGFKFWDDQKHFLKLTIHVRRDGVSGTEVNT